MLKDFVVCESDFLWEKFDPALTSIDELLPVTLTVNAKIENLMQQRFQA